MGVEQTLIRHKHANLVLLRLRSPAHTLMRMGCSALCLAELDPFLFSIFSAQSPFVAVQSLPRQHVVIREIITWRNLAGECCQDLLLACSVHSCMSFLAAAVKILHVLCQEPSELLFAGEIQWLLGFLFFRFRLCKP